MKLHYILIILLTVFLFSCRKKTEVSGIVFSRHNIPMPNVNVGIHRYRESSYPEGSDYEAAQTNDKGEYRISFRGQRKSRYEVFCNSNRDSGSVYESIRLGETNTIDLHLK